MGLVRYRGVIYPGKHPRLVEPETWQRVQDLLSRQVPGGREAPRAPALSQGHHPLRHLRRSSDRQPRQGPARRHLSLLRLHRPPEGQAQLQPARATHRADRGGRRRLLRDGAAPGRRAGSAPGLSGRRTDQPAARTPSTNAGRRNGASASSKPNGKSLLDAHLADAVPLDLLKSKQDGITAELAAIEGRLTEIAADFQRAEANLKRALARVGDCETAYREANDTRAPAIQSRLLRPAAD